MKGKALSILTALLGAALFGIGLILVFTNPAAEGIMLTLPYVSIGVGSGLFGHSMGEMLTKRAAKMNPELALQIEIEKEDERNIIISSRAKAKAHDMMIYVHAALLLAFTLLGVELPAVLLLVAAYLFIIGYGVYYHWRFNKEM